MESLVSSEQEVHIVTRNQLKGDLLACGIKKGDVIEVHASLKKVGYITGGPQTLIDAIIDVIGFEGTLVMAAQAHDNSEPAFFAHPPIPVKEYEAFREARPTNKGKLENFRNMGELSKALIARPNSYLSDHPQVAFVALGKYAKWITQSHPLSAQLGLDSPLGRCLELKSKIILIGVDYDNATGLHLGEHLSYKRPCILQGAKVLIHSEPTWVKFNAYDYDSDDFIEVGKRLEKENCVEFNKIGDAQVKIFKLEEATQITKAYFEEIL